MIRVCCCCFKFMGEKEPLKDKRITHSYCDECFEMMCRKYKVGAWKEGGDKDGVYNRRRGDGRD